MGNITLGLIKSKMSEVMDNELNISIVDLGLIYDIKQNSSGKTKISMTLTTIGCPLFSIIEDQVKAKLKELGLNPKDVVLELVFDPPWSMEKMSERAKAMLGI